MYMYFSSRCTFAEFKRSNQRFGGGGGEEWGETVEIDKVGRSDRPVYRHREKPHGLDQANVHRVLTTLEKARSKEIVTDHLGERTFSGPPVSK